MKQEGINPLRPFSMKAKSFLCSYFSVSSKISSIFPDETDSPSRSHRRNQNINWMREKIRRLQLRVKITTFQFSGKDIYMKIKSMYLNKCFNIYIVFILSAEANCILMHFCFAKLHHMLWHL